MPLLAKHRQVGGFRAIVAELAFTHLIRASSWIGGVGLAPALRRAPAVAAGPILLFGVERSGTSWLGKIFDSHPMTLYRHEPERQLEDFGLPWICADAAPGAFDAAASDYLRRMAAAATVKTTGPAPFFAKSYRNRTDTALHRALAHGLRTLAALEPRRGGLHNLRLPDLARGDRGAMRVVVKSVSGHGRAGLLTRAAADGQAVLLLRDPGGQVESVLRGAARGKFTESAEFAWIPATPPGRRHGLTAANLARMPVVEQLAWHWVVRNEMMLDDLTPLPNARVLRYDDLCADPAGEARALFAFTGLPWTRATEAFIAASVAGAGRQGYYTVFRDPAATLHRWRERLAPADRRRIAAILRQSALAGWWPDFPD